MKSRFVMVLVALAALLAPRSLLASDVSMDRPNEPAEELSGGGSGEPQAEPAATGTRGEHGTPPTGTGHGGMAGDMDCCAGMARADVTAENTPDGAVIRFRAKDRADVSRVQKTAHRMERCMGSGGARDRSAAPK